jgi:hypothetical protein
VKLEKEELKNESFTICVHALRDRAGEDSESQKVGG